MPRDKLDRNCQVSESQSTRQKLSAQLRIGEGTVQNAVKFTSAVDTIVKNTGIKVNDILSGKVKQALPTVFRRLYI